MTGGEPLLDFLADMRRLRRDCPWKREQTHRSLARYLQEETSETVEAIDTRRRRPSPRGARRPPAPGLLPCRDRGGVRRVHPRRRRPRHRRQDAAAQPPRLRRRRALGSLGGRGQRAVAGDQARRASRRARRPTCSFAVRRDRGDPAGPAPGDQDPRARAPTRRPGCRPPTTATPTSATASSPWWPRPSRPASTPSRPSATPSAAPSPPDPALVDAESAQRDSRIHAESARRDIEIAPSRHVTTRRGVEKCRVGVVRRRLLPGQRSRRARPSGPRVLRAEARSRG